MKVCKFNEIARILELKTEYDEVIDDLFVPQNRVFLNIDNAKWFLNNAQKFNDSTPKLIKTSKVCEEFLELAA